MQVQFAETGHTKRFFLKKIVQEALVSNPLFTVCRCSICTMRLRTASLLSKQEKIKLKCPLTTWTKKTTLAKVKVRCKTLTLSLCAKAKDQL